MSSKSRRKEEQEITKVALSLSQEISKSWCLPNCQRNHPCGQPVCPFAVSPKENGEHKKEISHDEQSGSAKGIALEAIQLGSETQQDVPVEKQTDEEGHIPLIGEVLKGGHYAVFTSENRGGGVYLEKEYVCKVIGSQVLFRKYSTPEEANAAYEGFLLGTGHSAAQREGSQNGLLSSYLAIGAALIILLISLLGSRFFTQ